MNIRKSFELVIFDCDGVLVDSEIISQRVLLTLLKEASIEVDVDYFNQHFLGRSFPHVVATIWEDFGIALGEPFRRKFRDTLFTAFTETLTPTDQVRTVLKQLTTPCCVATSSSPSRVAHSLATTELDHFFVDAVFTTSLVSQGKPAPDIFLYAAEQMGVAPANCLVIEDSLSGIKGGLAAGMDVVQYNGGTHMQYLGAKNIHAQAEVITSWPLFMQAYPELFTLKSTVK